VLCAFLVFFDEVGRQERQQASTAFVAEGLTVIFPVPLAITASMNFLGGTRLAEDKAFLAVYPLFLFYFVFSWMIMIQ
jgi:hypothetical protein